MQRPEIDAGDRLAQGHHKGRSLELYSRDRVIGQLRVQMQIRNAILPGKRFLVPQHRGSSRPVSEPEVEVVLEAYSKESIIAWGFFPFPEDLRQG